MSDPFYNYLSKIVVDYFVSRKLEGGERFNLYLERPETVDLFYRNLEIFHEGITSIFQYQHKEGDSFFVSYTLDIGGTKLLVASSEQATEDFITTLRNQVAKQEEQFKNTSLFILFSGKLDSLLGGSESLLKEGMPLNATVFRKRLSKEITQSESLKRHEKILLKHLLDKVAQESRLDSASIFDYKPIMSVIQQGRIKKADYPSLGLFPHNELATIHSEKDIQRNIQDNIEIFEKVEYVFKHGDPNNDLDRWFSDNGISDLKKNENWGETDYSDIVKWQEERKKTDPPEFKGVPLNECSEGLTIWERADGYSPAQKRRRNVLIFNPFNLFPIEVSFKFDKSISTDPLKTGKKDNIDLRASGHRIIAV
ncbi:MAG: hypothetical protein KDK45_25655, partial [Leptospiraceae bacterium]|nr:hypothetical protein [Leptospiraceae bacterium]